jgi:hypothetical protein
MSVKAASEVSPTKESETQRQRVHRAKSEKQIPRYARDDRFVDFSFGWIEAMEWQVARLCGRLIQWPGAYNG